MFSYLQFYYCKLDQARPVAFIILIIWLGLLFSTIGIAASDFFCINLGTIANVLGLSESMAGVTLLAFGNGSPDVFSTFAAMNTHNGSLAIGELIGAAGFITAVVAGSMAIVRPFKVAQKSFVRDVSFFIVAASFSMIFLADGHLRLWESAVMVGFYVFYVMTVVVWHWNIARKSYRREREVAARGHFHLPGTEESNTGIENSAQGGISQPRASVGATSIDYLANVEGAASPMLNPMGENRDGKARDNLMAEISGNMRVSRPRVGERRKTQNPIRPSFFGALEFRSVLLSLQNSRNAQSSPINLRRYSEDHLTIERQQGRIKTLPHPEICYCDIDELSSTSDNFRRPVGDVESSSKNRLRMVSPNDFSSLDKGRNSVEQSRIPSISILDATRQGTSEVAGSHFSYLSRNADPTQSAPQRWSTSLPDAEPEISTTRPPAPTADTNSILHLLIPLGDSVPGSPEYSVVEGNRYGQLPYSGGELPPLATKLHQPETNETWSRGSSKGSSFLTRCDDSAPMSLNLQLPQHGIDLQIPQFRIDSESPSQQSAFDNTDGKPVQFWPHTILPPPEVLVSTLFPTLYAWNGKSFWERILGIIAAPSIFLLAITLPVVEAGEDETTLDPDPGFLTPLGNRSRSQSVGISHLPGLPNEQRPDEWDGPQSHLKYLNPQEGHGAKPRSETGSNRQTNDHTKEIAQRLNSDLSWGHQTFAKLQSISSKHTPGPPIPAQPKEWNRWLLATQIFTAPFFIVVLYWANNDLSLSSRNLLLPALWGLLISLSLFTVLILTTTVSRPPRYQYLFCFLGFIVSIAWISTIASEVVGVLKAFGIILGISDAILGLTIFAVGNSLGDLVANITVARLGFPVMALSACFGGPMLNILLGIGLSGLYMTVKTANGRYERHPDKLMKYKPYEIDISRTLIISGITLLLTLVGLLIMVPMNRWRMDQRIGWGLVSLWTASTIGNVLMEVLGWGPKIE